MTFIQGTRSTGAAPVTWLDEAPEQLAMRQLRHLTKNAMQRLLCHIAACTALQRDPAGRALAHELERRIHSSVRLSDALFGLTQAPRSLESRLTSLGGAVVELMADGAQEIDVAVSVDGVCPPSLVDVVVRVAHELIGNAVKHGMHLRLVGRIEITVDCGAHGVTLSVVDDGWGLCMDDGSGEAKRGEGLRIAMMLARQHGGTLRLYRDGCSTVAMMELPPPGMIHEMDQ